MHRGHVIWRVGPVFQGDVGGPRPAKAKEITIVVRVAIVIFGGRVGAVVVIEAIARLPYAQHTIIGGEEICSRETTPTTIATGGAAKHIGRATSAAYDRIGREARSHTIGQLGCQPLCIVGNIAVRNAPGAWVNGDRCARPRG